MNRSLKFSQLPAITVALFCAMSFTAQSGVIEWEAHIKKGLAAYHRGDFPGAVASLAAAMKEAEALGDEQLPMTLSILGSQHLARGDYDAAEPLLQRSLAIREQSLHKHPRLARTLDDLAILYVAQRRYEEAEPLLKRALAIREENFGPEHRDVAASLDNLATLYSAQDKYAQAESLLQRSIAIWGKIFGTEHYEVAASLNNLATIYVAQGKYVRAEPLLQRSIAIWEKVGHAKNLARSKSNLEKLYAKMTGETDEIAVRPSFTILFENVKHDARSVQ